MPLRKDNNAAKFILSLKQNNSKGFIGAPQLFFPEKYMYTSQALKEIKYKSAC